MRKAFLFLLFSFSVAYGLNEPAINVPRQVYMLHKKIKPLQLNYYIDPVCGHVIDVELMPDSYKLFGFHYDEKSHVLSGSPSRTTTPDYYPQYVVLATNSCGKAGKGYFRLIVTAPVTAEAVGDRLVHLGNQFSFNAKDYYMSPNEASGDVQFDSLPVIVDANSRATSLSSLGLRFNKETGVLSSRAIERRGKYSITFSAHNNIEPAKEVKNAFWLTIE
jgi:hypothetical protein